MNPTTIDEAIALAKQVVEDAKSAKTQVCYIVFTHHPAASKKQREVGKEGGEGEQDKYRIS